jgi:AraC-like DNA-binding protein
MMKEVNRQPLPDDWLSYSCYAEMMRVEEQFTTDHVFSHIREGSLSFHIAGSDKLFHAEEMILVRRNQLAKCTKYPSEAGQFKSISIRLTQETLRSFSLEEGTHVSGAYHGESIVRLRQDAFYRSFIDSLSPYLSDARLPIDESLKQLKAKEAILHLLRLNRETGDLLFDFNEPGKIDLEEFMIRHFTFNVEMKQFAYLTGRSLATFKRDFEKIFHSPPGRWLQQKRLAQAYYLIKEKGKKPSDVYLDVGFEDLSHFSFAFKKEFGKAPSSVH